MDILSLTVSELSRALRARELSSVELTRAYLSEIDSNDKELCAYITVTHDRALKKAAEIDSRKSFEGTDPLAGIPYALKDNILTRGIKTTCASRMLENYIPVFDAFAVERLEERGGILLGKLNMDEFAMGSTTANSYFKRTKNPHELERVPGGSSGGAAAAVAANEAPYALGSDTGGSIRQPAAFCGCVGMKPTYGRVSRYGLIAFASSLDQLGPITKDVYDNAMILGAIAARDRRDATSVGETEDFTRDIASGVKGLRIGIPKEFFEPDTRLDSNVRAAVMRAAERFERLGARLTEISLSSLEYSLAAYYIISSCEASSNLARYDGIRFGHRAEGCEGVEELYSRSRSEGFGAEVKRRIMLGTFALSAGYFDRYYKKALDARELVREDFRAAFDSCDIILTPTAPTVAYRFDERPDTVSEYLGDIFTTPASLAGLPAMSMPCGASDGLPIGMQLIGRSFDERTIYRAGFAYEADKGGKG